MEAKFLINGVTMDFVTGLPTISEVVLAYLDPGTGSMILQALIAGLVGAAFAIKMFWHKITSGLARLFGKSRDKQSNDKP